MFNIFLIFSGLCGHFVDLVKNGVLTHAGKIPHYRNDYCLDIL